jgi:riboflavin transporter FmnP
MNNKKFSTRELTTLAMLTAIAYALVATVRIPIVLFLKYEPKDVIITIGGFLMGPGAVLASSFVVALIEMFTISDTGIIGCIMNLLSTCSFAFTAAYVYKQRHTMSGAIAGLVTGSVVMVITMLLWNYLITPLYMTGTSRSDIAGMLMPVFLPFNLLKAGLNSACILLLYKPVVNGLRRAGLLPAASGAQRSKKIGVTVFAALLLVTCILFVLVLRGII